MPNAEFSLDFEITDEKVETISKEVGRMMVEKKIDYERVKQLLAEIAWYFQFGYIAVPDSRISLSQVPEIESISDRLKGANEQLSLLLSVRNQE